MYKALSILKDLKAQVRWISFEPLAWNVYLLIDMFPGVLQWAVIGAGTDGRVAYQPQAEHVEALLSVLDKQNVPVFFNGNLEWSPWREDYPRAG